MKEILQLIKKFDLKALLILPTENELLQFLRYVFVGGIATVIDWGVLYALTEIGLYYILSAIVAFLAGLTVNFAMSKVLVFKANEAKVGAVLEFVGYAVVGVIGLGLTVVIMYLLTDCLHWHYMLSKIVSTVLVLFWNYVGRKKLLYKSK